MIRRTLKITLVAMALLIASRSRADQVIMCPGKVFYYVLFPTKQAQIAKHATLKNYFEGYLKFPAEILADGLAAARDHWRTVDERSTLIIWGVCEGEAGAFEASRGISSSVPIHENSTLCSGPGPGCSDELFALRSAGGKRIGTKWQDTEKPHAEGGGVAIQTFFRCAKPRDRGPQLIVADTAAFHSGLSTEAISASELAKEEHWFKPVRYALRLVTIQHILKSDREPCSSCIEGMKRISYEDFLELAKKVDNVYRIHYDVYDPNYGQCGTPGRCEEKPDP